MAQSTIAVRVDAEDKKEFERFCNATGMNISVAINMFLKNVIKSQALPFKVESDPFYSKENMKRIKKSISDVKSGKKKLTEHALIKV